LKFLCLAYEEGRALNDLSPDAWAELRDRTLEYVDELRATGRLISAHPLRSARTAATVRVRDGKPAVIPSLQGR
jgi:hypothetical protein